MGREIVGIGNATAEPVSDWSANRRAIRYPFPVTVWIAVLLAGFFGVGLVVKRVRGSSSRSIDAGEISESWLREQRAEKQRDRFS